MAVRTTNNAIRSVLEAKDDLTQDTVRELLDYDPVTGFLTWRHRSEKWFSTTGSSVTWNKRFAGTRAGTNDSVDGQWYIRLRIMGRSYLAHRLIWFWVTGKIPEEIDHTDQNKANNAWANLREVSHSENGRNTPLRSNNTSGVTGVNLNRHGKWQASIATAPGVIRHLGTFDSLAAAAMARREAETAHKYHPNHGKQKE